METDRPVLVTGASGFVGSHLVDHLVARGRRVRALIRRTSDRRWLHPAAEVFFGDVTRPLSLPPALDGVGVVYHVAGVIATFRPRTFDEVNGGGTRSLLLAVRKAAPDLDRFVLVSSLAAAGPSRDGRPVRESDPPRPVSDYGRSKLLGERIALGMGGKIPITVVRPPVVYGPRDAGVLSFFEMAARGIEPTFPREKYYSLCHVTDLVRGIRLAGESHRSPGRTYHLADPTAYALRHLLGLIADAVGATPVRIPVPEPVLPLVAGPLDHLARSFRLSSRPMYDKVRELRPDYWIADVTRAGRDLGFRTEVPLEEGLKGTAEFYREAGWIPV